MSDVNREEGGDPGPFPAVPRNVRRHTAPGVAEACKRLALIMALADRARPVLGHSPADCTNACADGPCDCSGVTRWTAWDLDPAEVRRLADGR